MAKAVTRDLLRCIPQLPFSTCPTPFATAASVYRAVASEGQIIVRKNVFECAFRSFWPVLAILLSLGVPQAAHAQGSYTVTYSGGTAVRQPGDTVTQDSGGGGGNYFQLTTSPTGVQSSSSVACSGSITATFTWNGGRGNASPPPVVVIKEEEQAYYEYAPDSANGSGSATCDISGAVQSGPPASGDIGETETATVLTVVDNPGQSFTFTRSPAASVSATSPQGAYQVSAGAAGVLYEVTMDDREVSVNSSLGMTYHSSNPGGGQGTPVADLNVDNTINANTVLPGNDSSGTPALEYITYSANPSGSWGASSAYQWSNTLGVQDVFQSDSGTFTIPTDYPYNFEADYSNNFVNTGSQDSQEQVKITLTDSADGAKATGQYNLTFHNPVENWVYVEGSSKQTGVTLLGSTDGGQPPNRNIDLQCDNGQVELQVGEQALGGVLTYGSAMIGLVADETPAAPLWIGLAAAEGYTLGLAPSNATQQVPVSGSQGQFHDDINTQNAIDSGNTSGIFDPTATRVNPEILTRVAADNETNVFEQLDGPLSWTVGVYAPQMKIQFNGDGYNASGYSGLTSGWIKYPGTYQYVYNWSSTIQP